MFWMILIFAVINTIAILAIGGMLLSNKEKFDEMTDIFFRIENKVEIIRESTLDLRNFKQDEINRSK